MAVGISFIPGRGLIFRAECFPNTHPTPPHIPPARAGRPPPPGERGCNSSWSLAAALLALESRPLLLDRCLPFDGPRAAHAPQGGAAAAAALCAAPRRCGDAGAAAPLGAFGHRPLEGAAEAQAHIRDWGAVVTRFDVFSDFVPFYEDKGNAKRVYSPGKGAVVVMHHAVALVGYSNEGDAPYWIAR